MFTTVTFACGILCRGRKAYWVLSLDALIFFCAEFCERFPHVQLVMIDGFVAPLVVFIGTSVFCAFFLAVFPRTPALTFIALET